MLDWGSYRQYFFAPWSIPVPLCRGNYEDLLFWPRNPNGVYSVKLGYKLLMECDLEDCLTTSNLSLTKKIWNSIWSLRIPNRVKSLLWRAKLDSLPTRLNLRKRRLLNDDSCPHCNLDKESALHALLPNSKANLGGSFWLVSQWL